MQLLQRLHELDAAAFAPASSVDLRLDDEAFAAELAGERGCLLRRLRDAAIRHRGAIVLEQGLGLIFVNVHGRSSCRRSGAELNEMGIDTYEAEARFGAILWHNSTSAFTDSTECMKASFSAELRSSSITRSTPLALMMMGTPA